MKILVACEFSGVVREAFRAKGHDAWSSDLLPADDGSEFHIQGDVLECLEDGWDMMIAHPPCTYLASSGLHWNKRIPGREDKTHEAMIFFLNLIGEGFIRHGIKKIAVENPIGRISTEYRKPDQIIQPWQFGHTEQKATCLWLKNLPLLKHNNVVGKGEVFTSSTGKKYPACDRGLKFTSLETTEPRGVPQQLQLHYIQHTLGMMET